MEVKTGLRWDQVEKELNITCLCNYLFLKYTCNFEEEISMNIIKKDYQKHKLTPKKFSKWMPLLS